jgi:hypothetical protein
MAYPRSFGRIVVSGSLYTTEAFSFSLSVVPTAGNAPALDAGGKVQAIAGTVSNYWGVIGVSQAASLDLVKYNEIGTDGKYESEAETNLVEFPAPVKGISPTLVAPQIALAVSLLTAARRGRAHAGRYYLPVPGAQVQADGRIAAGNAEQFADSSAEFINDLNNNVGPGWAIGVASKIGAGTFRPVTTVRVGRVLDTIRSRRTSLDEMYEVADAAVG